MRKILALITVFLLIMGGLFAQQNKVWDYPVKPGSEEWKSFKSNRQKVEACQIPDNILLEINSNDLMDLVINYPLLRDIMAFNFLEDGIFRLRGNFNGFNEFLSRKDAAKVLFSRYKKIKPEEFDKNWSLIQKGDYAINIMILEIFLSQREVLRLLSIEEKKELARELLIKLKEKNNPEIYDRLSQMTIALCLIRILEQEDALTNMPLDITKNDLLLFSEKANLQNTRLLPSIIVMAENFIK